MLVLSRKEGEKLVIGDNITLVVSKISGNRVTLGIEAPADVKIFRGELSPNDDKAPRGVVPMRRNGQVTIEVDAIGFDEPASSERAAGDLEFGEFNKRAV